MKILYLTDTSAFQKSGILNKVNNQIDEWTRQGHEVYYAFFPVSPQPTTESYITINAKDVFSKRSKWLTALPQAGFNYINKLTTITHYRNYISVLKPDVVYMRELVAFPGLSKLVGSAKTVIEANSLISEEMRLRRGGLTKIFEFWQKKVNNNLSGVIGVTHEITKQFGHLNIPKTVISNGIPLDIAEMRKKIKQNKNPSTSRKKIVMVCSHLFPWHGVDKYIALAAQMPDHDFHLIGSEMQVDLVNFFNHAYMDKKELNRFLEDADIAVGSLGLHRNNMNEACPLKVREYASLLLPMILAYYDTDLHDVEFVLQIDNTETTIIDNISGIRKFIEEWAGKNADPETIYHLVSATEKECQRLKFLQKIVDS